MKESDLDLKKIAYLIVGLSFLMGIILYPSLPDPMPTHWNASGEVDGHIAKVKALFIFPIIMLLLVLLFRILPNIDPLKKNYHHFRPHYDHFILIITGFMFYVYVLILLFSLGLKFNMTLLIMPGLAVLFFYIGLLLEHAKQNWFIGIRTPWTLSSKIVWKKTHWLAAKLFKWAAGFALVSVFFGPWGVWIGVIPLILAALVPVVYSAIIYKDKTSIYKEKKDPVKKKRPKKQNRRGKRR